VSVKVVQRPIYPTLLERIGSPSCQRCELTYFIAATKSPEPTHLIPAVKGKFVVHATTDVRARISAQRMVGGGFA
jgi:hypothetical protein